MVFAYARRCLATRPALWLSAAVCSALIAIPAGVAALSFAPSGVAALLTGDAALAASLLPEWARLPSAAAVTIAILGLVGAAAWVRIYTAGVWASDERNAPGLRDAWTGSRPIWPRVAVLLAGGYAALAGIAVGLFLLIDAGGAEDDGLSLLTALVILVGFRTVSRVYLSQAVRAAVFEDLPPREALKKGVAMVAARRQYVVATWLTLAALGAAMWIGGRLITPVLQDTAFDFDPGSAHAALRELAQLLIAIPIEAALIAIATCAWSAVYLDKIEDPSVRAKSSRRSEDRAPDPLARRIAAAALAVVVVVNGIAVVTEEAAGRAENELLTRAERREISPEEAIGERIPPPDGSVDTYVVEARLEGGELHSETEVAWVNDTTAPIWTLGVNVYAAAYTRQKRDIPLAKDLLAADMTGTLASRIESGTLDVSATVGGRGVPAELEDTYLLIELPRPVPPGGTARATVALDIEMPTWPERFGTWEDITLLGNWIPVVARRDGGLWVVDEFGTVGDPFYGRPADYSISLDVDSSLGVVGSGVLTGVASIAAGVRRWTFEARSSRDAAFAIGSFLRGLETEAEGATIRSWYRASDRQQGLTNLNAASSAFTFYSRSFGALPFDETDVIETGGLTGGMEYPGVVFVSSDSYLGTGLPVVGELTRYSGLEDAITRYVVGHEMAHQWWYATVGNDQIREPWLDEAMSEISTRLWLRSLPGDGDRRWRFASLSQGVPPRPGVVGATIEGFESNAGYTDAVYSSGSEVLLAVHDAVGQTRFIEILRAWFQKSYLDEGTIDGFIETVRALGGTGPARTIERFR
ncbi:MAG TPA: M1 family aminopeptidase [Actinomycetota bacterium]|nr:M1 family aminopeptidase [Actinomycetota bacterium]